MICLKCLQLTKDGKTHTFPEFQVNEEYLKCKFANNGDPFKCADKGKAVTERSKQL